MGLGIIQCPDIICFVKYFQVFRFCFYHFWHCIILTAFWAAPLVFLLFFSPQPGARPPHTLGLRAQPGGELAFGCLFAKICRCKVADYRRGPTFGCGRISHALTGLESQGATFIRRRICLSLTGVGARARLCAFYKKPQRFLETFGV